MRPIVSNINSPGYNLSKWLNRQFNGMEKFESCAVKNSVEFLEKVKNMQLGKNDLLVSFDVVSLFPSVPLPKTLDLLKGWLSKNGCSDAAVKEFLKLTKVAVENSYLQFNNKVYKQKEGLSMGNPLSPFLADLFMSNFETKILRCFFWLFKFWCRYVDDIFCIVDKKNVADALKFLNLQETSVKFTCEVEEDGVLPFLDLKIIRKESSLFFDIYRKPTSVDLYINQNSFNPPTHKMAVFNSLIDRMFRVPLSDQARKKERDRILVIAEANGYDKEEVKKMMKKKMYSNRVKEVTTLKPEEEKSNLFASITYHPKVFHKFKKVFKKFDLNMAPVNRLNVKNFFHGKLKDTKNEEEMAGIYEISCQDCDKVYVGQTRRNIKIRAKEHHRNVRNRDIDKSAVAKHCYEEAHEIKEKPKLLQRVEQSGKLNIVERMFMYKRKEKLMNDDLEGLENPLFRCLDSKPRTSRKTRADDGG